VDYGYADSRCPDVEVRQPQRAPLVLHESVDTEELSEALAARHGSVVGPTHCSILLHLPKKQKGNIAKISNFSTQSQYE
jgi:hypothetical protein